MEETANLWSNSYNYVYVGTEPLGDHLVCSFCRSVPLPYGKHMTIICVWEELPTFQQLFPDTLHDQVVGTKEDEEVGLGVVEAVQQNLRNLSLLLFYQPKKNTILSIW